MSAYSTSTHALHWIFTPAALAEEHRRRQSATLALQSVESSGAQAEGAAGATSAASASGQKRPRPLDDGGNERGEGSSKRARAEADGSASLAQEQAYLDWCCLALLRMCRLGQLDRAVTATALVYLRRFYVRSLFVHYPPHEMLCVCGLGVLAALLNSSLTPLLPPRNPAPSTAALFLAIKAEACPYTEVEELTTRTLKPLDARWRAECAGVVLAQLEGAAAPAGASPAPAPSASIASHRSALSPAGSDPLYLAHEVPLFSGLRFHVTVHHAYRPLKALLRCALQAHCAAPTPSPPSPVDAAAWDALQARAVQVLDLALCTDLPLLASPARLALGALVLAGDAGWVLGSSSSSSGGGGAGQLTLRGAGGVEDEAAEGAGSSSGAAAGAALLFPALAAPPPATLAPWVQQWARAQGEGEGAAPGPPQGPPPPIAPSLDLVVSTLKAFGAQWGGEGGGAADARARALLATLEACRDASLVPGTPAHGARVEALRSSIAAYKAGKAGRALAASAAHSDLLAREAREWQVKALE